MNYWHAQQIVFRHTQKIVFPVLQISFNWQYFYHRLFLSWIYFRKHQFSWNEYVITILRDFFMFKSFCWSDYFERPLVWSEAISSALQSDQRRVRAHTLLIRGDIRAHNSLIRWGFRAHSKRTRSLERTLVWSEDRSVWLGVIRGQLCLGWSDQRPFRSGP